jgi:hypothetical protein
MKKIYDTPDLVKFGTVEELTHSGTSNQLDAQESQSREF